MSDREYTLDELRQMDEYGEAVADAFEGWGITGVVFASGDDEPCNECGLRVFPNDPRYATSAAHLSTCSSYLWDQKR